VYATIHCLQCFALATPGEDVASECSKLLLAACASDKGVLHTRNECVQCARGVGRGEGVRTSSSFSAVARLLGSVCMAHFKKCTNSLLHFEGSFTDGDSWVVMSSKARSGGSCRYGGSLRWKVVHRLP